MIIMKILLSYFILLTSLLHSSFSFENKIWRGTTTQYYKGLNNKIDFNNVFYNYNITKFTFNQKKENHLNLRLRFYDNFGGVISQISKSHNWILDNKKTYISEINFFQHSTRTLIIFNYTYNIFNKLELCSINTSALRSGKNKNYLMKIRITNISNFIELMTKFNFCKTTKINLSYPNSKEIKYYNKFLFEYFFRNENRINKIFTDNLIISLPMSINDYEPFTFIIGCFISLNKYKQLNFNYNFKGELISIEFNEYIFY